MSRNMPTILYLDGDCVVCQKSARWLHKRDKRGRLHFAPLQGETARQNLPAEWLTLEDDDGTSTGAAVLAEKGKNGLANNTRHWRGPDAILRSLYLLGWPWKILWPLHWLPRFLKDAGYNLIARNRHRLGGGKECELPSAAFQKQTLP